MKRLLLAIAMMLAAAAGQVQSVNQQILVNATAAGPTTAVRNVGQASHWLFFCFSHSGGGGISYEIGLEASFDGVTYFGITDKASGTADGCDAVEAGGYFPIVRANVYSVAAATPSVNAWYSGLTTTIPGGGLSLKNKTAQPVSQRPVTGSGGAYGALNTAAGSTFANGTNLPVIVYSVHAENTAGAAAYIALDDDLTGSAPKVLWMRKIAAGADVETTFPLGLEFTNGVRYRCAADRTLTTNTAAGTCLLNMVTYKSPSTVVSQANAAGTVTGSRTNVR